MHSNPSFRQASDAQAIAFARGRSFGVLTASSPDGPPLVSHLPFLLNGDGDMAELHMARPNPIARACKEHLPVTLVVSGPDGYVSPDWYGIEDQVPTWNYAAVHLTGVLHRLPADRLPDMLARQSAAFEDDIPGKTPWTMDKMTADTKARFLRMILPFELRIDTVSSTFKLNQNKPDAARLRAAEHIRSGLGSELDGLAQLMRQPPQAE
ncbi:FMN-binding negative transcriptional regulator [Sagittula sp. SSi028]|uniref:FMN-binding negative transcriptional regulator n=1 Tax=Sagittula sp. SSi028 TaxID=3400636 RepID=UPI003AF8ABC1